MKTGVKFVSFLRNLIVFIALSPLFFSCEKNEEEPIKDYILIYNGKVADDDGVIKIAEMAEENGYNVAYISDISQLPEMLDNAVAFVIGGTDDETGDLLEDLYQVQDDLVTYIENGGNYLGICGGAYIATNGSQWADVYETGMGLVDIQSFAYDSIYTDPQIITITWLETQRTIYYQFGPAFARNTIPADSEILAYYNNANQDVAIFKTTLGEGTIILCGPHPEADATWLIDDPEPINAKAWTETKDIFQEIFTELGLRKSTQ